MESEDSPESHLVQSLLQIKRGNRVSIGLVQEWVS